MPFVFIYMWIGPPPWKHVVWSQIGSQLKFLPTNLPLPNHCYLTYEKAIIFWVTIFPSLVPRPIQACSKYRSPFEIFPNRPGNEATIGPFICEHNHEVASMCDRVGAFMDLEKISLSTFGAQIIVESCMVCFYVLFGIVHLCPVVFMHCSTNQAAQVSSTMYCPSWLPHQSPNLLLLC